MAAKFRIFIIGLLMVIDLLFCPIMYVLVTGDPSGHNLMVGILGIIAIHCIGFLAFITNGEDRKE